MKKTLILYTSYHHGNTKKIVEAMKEEIPDITVIDFLKTKEFSIKEYEYIGFASGIYFGKQHKKMLEYLETREFESNQKCFFIATAGIPYKDYTKISKSILKERKIDYFKKSFQCKGYDTYGIFRKIGLSKKHPDEKDLKKAKEYIKEIVNS